MLFSIERRHTVITTTDTECLYQSREFVIFQLEVELHVMSLG
jgi:hypothetical protein